MVRQTVSQVRPENGDFVPVGLLSNVCGRAKRDRVKKVELNWKNEQAVELTVGVFDHRVGGQTERDQRILVAAPNGRLGSDATEQRDLVDAWRIGTTMFE